MPTVAVVARLRLATLHFAIAGNPKIKAGVSFYRHHSDRQYLISVTIW